MHSESFDNMTKKEIFLRSFLDEVWNQHRPDKVVEYLADSYTIHLDAGDPWEGKTIDIPTFKERLQHSFVPFPDIHFDVQSSVSDADTVAITWILTGTHLGQMGSLPPTGKKIRTFGTTIYYFRDGRLCGHSQVFDRAVVASQLGFG